MLRRLAPAAVSASAVATTEFAIVGHQKGVRRTQRLRHRPCRGGAIGAIFLERDDAPAFAPDRLLERGLDHIAIGVVGHQRGKGSFSGAGGIIDNAVDVGLRQEAQKIHTAAGDAGIGGERDHRHAARARELRGSRNRERKQRSQDDLRAFAQRLLRALPAPCGVAPSSLISSWMFGF